MTAPTPEVLPQASIFVPMAHAPNMSIDTEGNLPFFRGRCMNGRTIYAWRRPSTEDFFMEINENMWANRPVISPL